MGWRHFKPEQIIHMLHEAEIKLAGGKKIGEVCRELGRSEQSYYRWRKEYGGMQVSQAKKLKDLERENTRLKNLPQEPGTYVLVLRNRIPRSVYVGRLGSMETFVGYYLYVGSAFGPGGLRSRLSHHLKVSWKPHWHVDYLRRFTAPVLIWFQASSSPQEHRWVRIINNGEGIEVVAPRFGASDCRCKSHLFFSKIPPSLKMFCVGPFADGLGEGVREWSLVTG